jgi:hypothetical protein
MKARRVLVGGVFLALLLLLLPVSFPRAGGTEDARKAGWEEDTPGRWNSLPGRKVEADGDSFRAELVLSPGTGVVWEKRVGSALQPGDILSIEMVSGGTNRTSRDYVRYRAHFPLSVTVVFGEDSMGIPWKKRVTDFFREVWHGFTPGGIRLTFAFGNTAPEGSMYRLGEEETVFLVGGEGERGKRITAPRNIVEDFRAAYGREPKGPVTRILVSAERPSREDGPIEGEIRITSPLLR